MDNKTAAITTVERRNGFHTLSGAHIHPVSERDVRDFLARLSTPLLQSVPVALGAFEDDGTLVGVLAITGPEAGVGTVHIVVAPERRQLGIGTDLVQALFALPADRIGRPIRLCRAITAEIAERLEASFDIHKPRSRR